MRSGAADDGLVEIDLRERRGMVAQAGGFGVGESGVIIAEHVQAGARPPGAIGSPLASE